MTEKDLDIICIGRSSVDLYGEQVGGRLEDMATFAKYVGGCPTNIAIGTARLGIKSALITRVGDEQLGRFIVESLVNEGVDASHVSTDPERLTALVILGIRDRANIPHIFYRSDCADMAIGPDDIDPAFIARARAVLVTGTHMSKPGVEAATRKAVACAKAAGAKIVLDIDYRPVIWGLTGHEAGASRFVADETISTRFQTLLADCDLVVGTEEEVHIAGGASDTLDALQTIRELTDATIVLKRGADGCVAYPGPIPNDLADAVSVEGFQVEVYNTLGAGDGFMSGFLRGWLKEEPLRTCCRYGNACGAIVVSRHGCAPASPSWIELCVFLERGVTSLRLREDTHLTHIHRVTTRKRDWREVCAIAFDHRRQLEDLADRHSVDHARITQFKTLIATGAASAITDGTVPGALIDGKYGAGPLAALSDGDWWLARPVEKSGAVPLEFECGENIAIEMHNWPADHVAKCLIIDHSDAPEDFRGVQERRMVELYQACVAIGRELLLEVIPMGDRSKEPSTITKALARIYGLGICPDWWKLPPYSDKVAWRAISAVIDRHDPYCRGILVLGQEMPLDVLKQCFDATADEPLCKGFAVGRSIFQDVATGWFSGRIDDEATIQAISENYRRVIELWHGRGAA